MGKVIWPTRMDMIRSFGEGCVCAEIGVWHGELSRQLVKTNPKRLYLIDCWERQEGEYARDPTNNQDLKEALRAVQTSLGDNPAVTIMRQYSLQAATGFADGFFDWVYIDGNHTWPGITADLFAWWPKVKSGGWLCGHDYILDRWIEVGPVVDAFAKVRGVKVIVTLERQTSPDPVSAEIPSWGMQKP